MGYRPRHRGFGGRIYSLSWILPGARQWDNAEMKQNLTERCQEVPLEDKPEPAAIQDAPDAPHLWGQDTPVFLVGLMGAGKTTVGKGLARARAREFLDLDHELEARCGVKIPVIFEIEGEEGFRKRESQVLDDCTQKRNIVLATGGGAVMHPDNRQALKTRGVVIYLRASVEELYRRTGRDKNRPLLATGDARATLKRLLDLRDPLYREVADITVDTGSVSVATLVQQIVDLLHSSDFKKPCTSSM